MTESIIGKFRSAAVAAMALVVCVAAPAKAQDKQITIMIWGTVWQSSFKEISENFTKETGIKVAVETQTSAPEGLVKLQAMRAKPSVDVWFTTLSVASRAAVDNSLFAELPLAKMDSVSQVIPGSTTKNWAAIAAFPLVMLYRTDMIQQPLNSWEDLWKPVYKNKLAMPNMAMYQARMLLLSATLSGGNERNIDPGFEKLKALKPNVAMFYSSDAQARQALAQGEVAAVFAPPMQLRWLNEQGVPAKAAALRPAPLEFDVAMLVKTGKEDMGAAYVNYLLRKDVNEFMAQKRNIGPVNVGAKVPDSLADIMPPAGQGLLYDENFVNASVPVWTERFNREIAK